MAHYEAPIRRPLVTGDKTYHDVTLDIVAPVRDVQINLGGSYSLSH